MAESRDQRKERMQRITGSQSAAPATPDKDEPSLPGMPTPTAPATAPRVPTTPPRVKPYRTTVELSPREYKALKGFSIDAADILGTSVASSEVLRTLLGLMVTDDDLARRVRNELGRTGGHRRRR